MISGTEVDAEQVVVLVQLAAEFPWVVVGYPHAYHIERGPEIPVVSREVGIDIFGHEILHTRLHCQPRRSVCEHTEPLFSGVSQGHRFVNIIAYKIIGATKPLFIDEDGWPQATIQLQRDEWLTVVKWIGQAEWVAVAIEIYRTV